MIDWLVDNVVPGLLLAVILGVAGFVLRHWLIDLWYRRPWPRINRAPRTPAETRRLLAVRPPGWEWLHFAGELHQRLAQHEERYRDHETRYVRPSDLVLREDGFAELMGDEFDRMVLVIGNWEALMNGDAYERAVGKQGEVGDPARIAHLADRLTATYVQVMDWSDRLRGARVPERYRQLVNVLARFPDQPIRQHRQWVADVVSQIDRVPALLRVKERPPLEITLELVLSIDPDTIAQWQAEYARLNA